MKKQIWILFTIYTGTFYSLHSQAQITATRSSLGPGNMMAAQVSKIRASSHLIENKRLNHKAENIADNKKSTSWVEGVKGYGIGQWIEFQITTDQICFLNGFQKNNNLWKMNSRVKSFYVYFNNQKSGTINLLDTMKSQCLVLRKLKPEAFSGDLPIVRLQIKTVYPGTRFDDTCISEIWSQGG